MEIHIVQHTEGEIEYVTTNMGAAEDFIRRTENLTDENTVIHTFLVLEGETIGEVYPKCSTR